jgi:hypothetical protein
MDTCKVVALQGVRVVLMEGLGTWQRQYIDLFSEDGFIEDGGNDFCSVRIWCTLRVRCLWMMCVGRRSGHKSLIMTTLFIRLVNVGSIIAKKVASGWLVYYLVRLCE